jgi:hypothetical protein
MIKKLIGISIGVLFISASIYLLFTSKITEEENLVNKLPDYDYIAEINKYIEDKNWSQANILCEDVISLDLPCAKEAAKLKIKAEKESKKIKNRLYKAVKGFITGSPDNSIEELGGSVASDMFLYGDVRDLIKQGWYKITGKETDPVVVALSTLGLVTEAIDAIDWAPGTLKAFRKAGAISNSLGSFIIDISKQIVKTKKLGVAGDFFKNFKTILDQAEFARSTQIIKYASNANDISLLAKSTKISANSTHLVSRFAKENTCDVIKLVNTQSNQKTWLKTIAQKGLKATKYIKTSARIGKIIYKQQISKFLFKLLGKYFYILCIGLFVIGTLIIARSIKR